MNQPRAFTVAERAAVESVTEVRIDERGLRSCHGRMCAIPLKRAMPNEFSGKGGRWSQINMPVLCTTCPSCCCYEDVAPLQSLSRPRHLRGRTLHAAPEREHIHLRPG